MPTMPARAATHSGIICCRSAFNSVPIPGPSRRYRRRNPWPRSRACSTRASISTSISAATIGLPDRSTIRNRPACRVTAVHLRHRRARSPTWASTCRRRSASTACARNIRRPTPPISTTSSRRRNTPAALSRTRCRWIRRCSSRSHSSNTGSSTLSRRRPPARWAIRATLNLGTMMTDISRREIIAGTAAHALTSASSAALAQQGAAKPAPKQNAIDLECAFKDMVLDGTKMRLRAFNGQIPGPPMKIFPGQRVRINLKNSLPPYDSSAWSGDHNVPHHLGSTNLHVHGLNVIPHLFEPIGTSDPQAPMIEIMPGESKQYVFDIPADHPPGLNWYHPHHHGSTAVQAVTGMAGGIIVYGAIDEVPEIKAAKDYLLVMQDIGLFPSEDDPTVWTYLPKQNAIWQTFSSDVTIYDPQTKKPVPTSLQGGFTTGDYKLRYYLTNGEPFFKEVHDPKQPTNPTPSQLKPPRFTLAPGEVVRFHMLNACSDNYMPITVEGHDLHLLALDGVNFPKVRVIPPTPVNTDPGNEGQIQLAPANRAEFMIKGAAVPGIYRIVQLQQTQQFLFSAQKTIAEIEITGAPVNMALPVKLPIPTREYPLIKPGEIQNLRVIYFADQFPGTQNPY